MASTSKGKARKHQEEPHTFLSDLDILQARQNYCVTLIKGTDRRNPLGKDFLAYVQPATNNSPEEKFPVYLYQGVWHKIRYTHSGEDKLVYLANPCPDIHDYDTELPKRISDAPTSKSDTEKDPLNITIHNSPALLKEPLALETPVTPTPFFSITKNDLLQ